MEKDLNYALNNVVHYFHWVYCHLQTSHRNNLNMSPIETSIYPPSLCTYLIYIQSRFLKTPIYSPVDIFHALATFVNSSSWEWLRCECKGTGSNPTIAEQIHANFMFWNACNFSTSLIWGIIKKVFYYKYHQSWTCSTLNLV